MRVTVIGCHWAGREQSHIDEEGFIAPSANCFGEFDEDWPMIVNYSTLRKNAESNPAKESRRPPESNRRADRPRAVFDVSSLAADFLKARESQM